MQRFIGQVRLNRYELLLKLAGTTLWVLSLTFIGFLLAAIIVEYRIFDKFSRRMVKLAKLTNIHPAALVAILGYVTGPRVAHGVLSELLFEGVIREGDVFSAILIAGFLCRVYIILRWFIPVVLPLLGPELALKLLCFNITIDAILTIAGFFYAKLRLRPPVLKDRDKLNSNQNGDNVSEASCKKALKRAFENFAKFALKYIVLSIAIGVFLLLGFFDVLNDLLKPYVVMLGLNPKAAAVTAVYLLQPSAALIICSNMPAIGEITPLQALPAILLGSSFFTLFHDCPKNIMPYYLSVYPKNLSLKLLIVKIVVPSVFYMASAILLCML